MPSNKETLFQEHICAFLESVHQFRRVSTDAVTDREFHFIEDDLIAFINATQADKFAALAEDYATDARREIFEALKREIEHRPLWLVVRNGLNVRNTHFDLYKPKPRSKTDSLQEKHYKENIFAFAKEYYYNQLTQERIDLVIWLNGLPVIVAELKHEDEGQTCDDAIYQSFVIRDLENKIFHLPFAYFAISNTEAKVATSPRDEKNFRWFNAALVNEAETTDGTEYPVEYLYRHAFAKEAIAKYLEHFLVYVSAVDKADKNGVRIVKDAETRFPRYHQLRASLKLANDLLDSFNETRTLGNRYLINHSAGSGKTLTIAWMADLLDSLYAANNAKIFDNIIILTDRRSLDKNIKDDLELFTHLTGKVNFAKKSRELERFLKLNRDIIVTTIQKFAYLAELIQSNADLKRRKVVFLIDEAHRSQQGRMALAFRRTFTPDGDEIVEEIEPETEEDAIAGELNRLDTSNQVFVAFTATTTAKTLASFGAPFDTYTEEEAIQEGYILDVAQNIVSYQTLYNLKIKDAFPDKEYPAGIVHRMLQNLAYADEGIIQYKSELIIKMFEERVADKIGGKAKAMVVASTRPAGLKYFNNLKTIIREKGLSYKVLFAFSDYSDPDTNQRVEEEKINELDTLHGGAVIEDVFDNDEYRILVVANKFQTGFDQPLLTAMFLDKVVNGVNAIQTVSRLNRKHPDKEQDDILVVDFTNNSANIFNAFNLHRTGTPYKAEEPAKEILQRVYDQIHAMDVFSDEEFREYSVAYIEAELEARKRNSAPDAALSGINQQYRSKFRERFPNTDDQKKYLSLLKRFAKLYYFIAQFFVLDDELNDFIVPAEALGSMLLKQGKSSELTQLLKNIDLSRGAVQYVGEIENKKRRASATGIGLNLGGDGPDPPRTSIGEAVAKIRDKYSISDADAIVISEICEEISSDHEIRTPIIANSQNVIYLNQNAKPRVRSEVKNKYMGREMWEKLDDPIYIDQGGIVTLMGEAIVNIVLSSSANA